MAPTATAPASKETRIAIISSEKCKPKKCHQECKKSCPVVRMGRLCIEVTPSSKIAFLSETLCIGCGICTKKCPFEAINIVKLPTNLDAETTHRYGANSFKLHRLPMPRAGQVLGLLGINGIGKSTALKILAGKQKPNLGRYDNPPDWEEIIRNFRGSELQNFFTKVLEENIKALIKPQYVDHIPRAIKGTATVSDMLDGKLERDNKQNVIEQLDLQPVLRRDVKQLSGGELQRFAIGMSCVQRANMYMFDEPSSYLDVKQRLNASRMIRSLTDNDTYVIAIDHDLAVLDYLSDFICCLYGVPGVYGVVVAPSPVRDGINIFLDGYIPSENMRFREESLTFKIAEMVEDEIQERTRSYEYGAMKKKLGDFTMEIEPGKISDSEIVVFLGENGTGKTTFVKMLAGKLEPDVGANNLPKLSVSLKPQMIAPKFEGTVRMLLLKQIRAAFLHPGFITDVLKPMQLDALMDQEVKTLSGGELQRVAIVMALGKPADLLMIDEGSSYLDIEQRLVAAKVIKRFVLSRRCACVCIEHDMIMATYLADKVIVFEGTPSVHATAKSPESLLTGINSFLAMLDVTFRRDPISLRPRINKANSMKDKEQKSSGKYFFIGDD